MGHVFRQPPRLAHPRSQRDEGFNLTAEQSEPTLAVVREVTAPAQAPPSQIFLVTKGSLLNWSTVRRAYHVDRVTNLSTYRKISYAEWLQSARPSGNSVPVTRSSPKARIILPCGQPSGRRACSRRASEAWARGEWPTGPTHNPIRARLEGNAASGPRGSYHLVRQILAGTRDLLRRFRAMGRRI